MISLPNRSLNQDESFFTNSAYCGKGCFFTAQKQSQAGCWHAWNGREQHYLFLGSLSFETSPILLYLAVDVFFGDRNINSQFREEHFFFGGGGWKSGWRICSWCYLFATSEAMLIQRVASEGKRPNLSGISNRAFLEEHRSSTKRSFCLANGWGWWRFDFPDCLSQVCV